MVNIAWNHILGSNDLELGTSHLTLTFRCYEILTLLIQ